MINTDSATRQAFQYTSIWVISIVAFCTDESPLYAQMTAVPIVQEIRQTENADEMVNESLDLLETAAKAAFDEMSEESQEIFDVALANRLMTLQASIKQHMTKKYQSALFAQRILELTEHVVRVGERGLPEKVDREEASRQYAAMVDRLTNIPGVDEELIRITTGPIVTYLENLQTDVFRIGYGRRLLESELPEVNAIVEKMVEQINELSKELNGQELPPDRIRDAAKIGTTGFRECSKYLRELSLPPGRQPQFAVLTWLEDTEVFRRKVAASVTLAERIETQAVIEQANQ